MSTVTCIWGLDEQGKGVICDKLNHTQNIIDACTAVRFFPPKNFGMFEVLWLFEFVFYDSERCHLLRASGYWRSKGKVPLTTYHRRVHCNRVFLSKRFWYSTSCRTTFGNSPRMRFCYTAGFATQSVLQHRCNKAGFATLLKKKDDRFCNTTSLCLLCKMIGFATRLHKPRMPQTSWLELRSSILRHVLRAVESQMLEVARSPMMEM